MLPPIVRMIQELVDTWGDVQRRLDGSYEVPILFDCEDDAKAFKIELMMAASGQAGYEKE